MRGANEWLQMMARRRTEPSWTDDAPVPDPRLLASLN